MTELSGVFQRDRYDDIARENAVWWTLHKGQRRAICRMFTHVFGHSCTALAYVRTSLHPGLAVPISPCEPHISPPSSPPTSVTERGISTRSILSLSRKTPSEILGTIHCL
jgi:hypothetical protein